MQGGPLVPATSACRDGPAPPDRTKLPTRRRPAPPAGAARRCLPDAAVRIDPTGVVSVAAGTGVPGSTGNDGAAVDATINAAQVAIGPTARCISTT